MDRSFGIAAGRRLSVAMLLFLCVSVPAGSRAVWDVSGGPSRLSGDGAHPGLSGLAASHRRERRSEGSRLRGAEPARLRSAHMRALGDRDVRRPVTHRPGPQPVARPGGPDARRVRDRLAHRGHPDGAPRADVGRQLGRSRSQRPARHLSGGCGRIRIGRLRRHRRSERERRRLPVPQLLRVRRRGRRLLDRAARVERRSRRSARDGRARVLPRRAVRLRFERGRVADGGHRRLDGGRGRRRCRREPQMAPLERARAPVGSRRQQPWVERIRRVDLLAVPNGERRRPG